MADERNQPFIARAYQNYQDEMASLKTVVSRLQEHEPGSIEEYREPLSMEERKEVTVLLSWGGPSDGYRVYFDREGEAVEGFYFLADWFEYEEIKLRDEELDRVLSVYFQR